MIFLGRQGARERCSREFYVGFALSSYNGCDGKSCTTMRAIAVDYRECFRQIAHSLCAGEKLETRGENQLKDDGQSGIN